MKLQTYYLKAISPFHFGEVGIDVEKVGEYASSDRLFSAICTVTLHTMGVERLRELLDRFRVGPPPFLLTGAYPYINTKDGKPIRFFPSPLTLKHAETKSVRKVRWVSETIFMRWLDGSLNTSGEPEPIEGKWLSRDELSTLDAGRVIETEPEKVFWSNDVRVPRVAVDRTSSASAIYHVGRLVFADGGLWCGFQIIDEKWGHEFIEYILDVMSDDGLGGERANGHGRFDLITEQEPLVLPDVSDYFVTLSHYCPNLDGEEAVFEDENAAYDLVLRRGFMSSPAANRQYPRQMIRMAVPGSVLRTQDRPFYGRLVDVSPIQGPDADVMLVPHPVYRYGFALPVGMRVKGETA